MGLEFSSLIQAPRPEVFAWHERKGAITRLTPPWQPVRVSAEAGSLRGGRAVLWIPPGIRWVAEHSGYRPPESFVDELTSLPLHWRHTHEFGEVDESTTRMTDRVETPVPGNALLSMFRFRHRQLTADLAAHRWAAGYCPEPRTVAITGSSGFVGSALTAFLSTGGHRVIRLVRREARSPDERTWNPEAPDPSLLDGVDAVIHLAGASIAGRFTSAHKRAIRDSRIGPTRRLAELLASDNDRKRCLIAASAIGYYGPDRGDEILTESSAQGDGFLAGVVADWESATDAASAAGCRVVNVRTGIVQSPSGGVLRLLYPLFAAGLGGRLGSGKQWMSWIGIDDLLEIYLRALVDDELSGAVNAVAPRPLPNSEYTDTLAAVLRRPAVLPTPMTGPRVLLGREGAAELAAADQRVSPDLLLRRGHSFRHPELADALGHVLGRSTAPH